MKFIILSSEQTESLFMRLNLRIRRFCSDSSKLHRSIKATGGSERTLGSRINWTRFTFIRADCYITNLRWKRIIKTSAVTSQVRFESSSLHLSASFFHLSSETLTEWVIIENTLVVKRSDSQRRPTLTETEIWAAWCKLNLCWRCLQKREQRTQI